MSRPAGQIIALGGGGFSMEPDNPLLDAYILRAAGKPRPRVCFVGTASDDSAEYRGRFYAAFAAAECEATHLVLPEVGDLSAFVAAQDVFYVGGGNTVAMLAAWRPKTGSRSIFAGACSTVSYRRGRPPGPIQSTWRWERWSSRRSLPSTWAASPRQSGWS